MNIIVLVGVGGEEGLRYLKRRLPSQMTKHSGGYTTSQRQHDVCCDMHHLKPWLPICYRIILLQFDWGEPLATEQPTLQHHIVLRIECKACWLTLADQHLTLTFFSDKKELATCLR